MQVTVAKTAGFCFGVRRALELTQKSAALSPTCTLGELIHNRQVVEALGGLPAHKLHCSVLAEESIKSAVKDYYDRNGIPYDHSQFPDCESCESCRMV